MHPAQAAGARRAALAASVILSTVAAHAVATGELHLLRFAPLLWAGLTAVAVLCGPRREWRPRRARAVAAWAVAGQAAVHAAATWSPWVLGLGADGHHLMLTPAAVAAHAAAAAVAVALLVRLEHLLDRATTITRAVMRAVRPRTAGRPGRPPALASPCWRPAGTRPAAAAGARGPPRRMSLHPGIP